MNWRAYPAEKPEEGEVYVRKPRPGETGDAVLGSFPENDDFLDGDLWVGLPGLELRRIAPEAAVIDPLFEKLDEWDRIAGQGRSVLLSPEEWKLIRYRYRN